jgi:hypothetical protein
VPETVSETITPVAEPIAADSVPRPKPAPEPVKQLKPKKKRRIEVPVHVAEVVDADLPIEAPSQPPLHEIEYWWDSTPPSYAHTSARNGER